MFLLPHYTWFFDHFVQASKECGNSSTTVLFCTWHFFFPFFLLFQHFEYESQKCSFIPLSQDANICKSTNLEKRVSKLRSCIFMSYSDSPFFFFF